jgi:cytochrome P450
MNREVHAAWAPRHAHHVGTDEFFSDPYPTWSELHAAGGIGFHAGEHTWLVSRYDDAVAILKDPRLSKCTGAGDPSPLSSAMLFQDPPAHGRLRSAVSDWFTAARVRSMESRIAEVADRLIDQVAMARHADFMSAFAVPLPIGVVAGIIGVPQGDLDSLHRWSRALSQTGGDVDAQRRSHGAALEGMAACFETLIDRRASAPEDDLVSALLADRPSGDRLSRREIVGTCMLLLIAGHETTVNLLGNGMAALLQHPDQYARLRTDRSLLPSAIEEMLRFESPVQRSTYRVAREPIEIRGRTIHPGQAVAALIGAANRDPSVFPDPHRFDIARSPNRHIAFGSGVHACLGAMLARTEARIAFERLFDRLGEMRAAAPRRSGLIGRVMDSVAPPARGPLRWQRSTMVRGLEALDVQW